MELEKLVENSFEKCLPQKFMEKCIFKFLNRIFERKAKVATAPKKEIRIVLPYLGNMSSIAKTKLTKAVNKNLKFCQLTLLCLIVVGVILHFFKFFTPKLFYNDPPILPKCKIRTFPHILLSILPPPLAPALPPY